MEELRVSTRSRMRGSVSLSMLCAWMVSCAAGPSVAEDARTEPRLLTVDDYFEIGEIGDPRISPDGRWIAYTVTTPDLKEDESRTRIWMVPAAGGTAVPLTAPDEDSSSPRWSPDGRVLGFMSSRSETDDSEGKTQVWTLFREGGEAVRVTDTAQDVEFFAWSPDGKRMLLVLEDPKPEELAARAAREKGEDYEEKTPPPWVVTRRQFKRDYVGYLESRRNHLYVLDVLSKQLKQITSGDFDDYCQSYLPDCDHTRPAWSPDGTRIAFVSNRTDDPDANYNSDVWVVEADNEDLGAHLVRITNNPGPDAAPSWSPDGKRIAHLSNIETSAALYGTSHLAVSSSTGGDSKLLTRDLDRMIFQPRFSRRDDSIYFLLEDSGEQNLARVSSSGGGIERIVAGPRVVSAFHQGPSGEIATLISDPHSPPEVFLFVDGKLTQRSEVNDALVASLRLGEVEEIRFASADGTEIEAFVVKPPGFSSRRRYPAILRIHGGPQAQYDFGFHFEAQLYAANGYVVVMPNPRGSTGYGQEFCLAIWRDWGGPDYEDVMASVDHIIDRGWADPERLAVTGWSYGGMLTNHVITKTDRFEAAATGASATLYVTNFGHDQYQRWWTYELGLPWEPESREIYERMSPLNKVENVVTPTLVVGGKEDWNVPIINSEQLFLALKMRGVPTELVVYPDEFHGIDTPSHTKDLYERYLAWFGTYLQGADEAEVN
jgi:dipeptidyl aminopeptidase/acylaminoacyl peptidase